MNRQGTAGKPIASSRWKIALAGGTIVLAALAVYHNTFSTPFIFDDAGSLIENKTIEHFWSALISQPGRTTVSGRPVLNVSLALNYALSGTQPWSYHALNLAIHLCAGLVLFGLIRRTLLKVQTSNAKDSVTGVAFSVALLWTLHPLQTEAVTYVIQRAESLMGLFYLLTLYCFIRGTERNEETEKSKPSPLVLRSLGGGGGLLISILFCLLGMATKEVMVSAPLMMLLYDRTFISGTFRQAMEKRRWFYLALASTWLVLFYLVISTGGNRGGSAGFNVGVSGSAYWLTQFKAIVHYLQLSVWPHPLVFEYGTFWTKTATEIVPYAGIVIALLAATVWALWRKPALGFLGAWFFAILAPTSLVPGTTQMIVEHRLYLPLAAVLVLLVAGLFAAVGRRSVVPVLILAAGLGWATERRNEDYRSELAIWSDTVAKQPDNARARNNYGNALVSAGRLAEAIDEYREALRYDAHVAAVHYNLANALLQVGQVNEALNEYQAVLRLKPRYAAAHSNLAVVLLQLDRTTEAVEEYRTALQLDPDMVEVHYDFGNLLLKLGRQEEAMAEFQEALRRDPDYAAAHISLADALFQAGRQEEAAKEYREGLRHKRSVSLPREKLEQL